MDKKQVHGVCQTSQSLLKDLVAAVVMKVITPKAPITTKVVYYPLIYM